VTVYTVPATQKRIRIQAANPRFQNQFNAVPLPADAVPSNCSDRHLSLWQPSTDTIWDFWKLTKLPTGAWEVLGGGRMRHASSNPGYFAPRWGATATSLPLLGGLIRLSEVQAGVIPHAVAFEVASPRKGVFVWPAQRTDGQNADPNSLPEGIRFRLDPTLDIAALNLPPLTRMIAEAVQRYGMVLRDSTHIAVGFYGEQPKPGEGNPYPAALGGLTFQEAMAKFPWAQLQVIAPHAGDCSVPTVLTQFPVACGSVISRAGLVLRVWCHPDGVHARVSGQRIRSVRSVTFRALRHVARDRARPFGHRWRLKRGRHAHVKVTTTARMRNGHYLRLHAFSPRCGLH
jgi:hypothetical protein